MTRFSGPVGFATPVRSNGVVENVITERSYKGDELRSMRYFRTGDSVLGEVSYQTRISIVADAYALENYEDIRYVVKAGKAWEIDSVEPERPRLILVLGGKYNGPLPGDPDE